MKDSESVVHQIIRENLYMVIATANKNVAGVIFNSAAAEGTGKGQELESVHSI